MSGLLREIGTDVPTFRYPHLLVVLVYMVLHRRNRMM